MNAHRAVLGSVLLVAHAIAGDAGALRFGGERIGVPPLSLSESIADRTSTLSSPRFKTTLPEAKEFESPSLSPKLIPRTTPEIPSPFKPRAPRVRRDSGMPIIVPSDAVDYAMKVVPPDPDVDFKLVIKDPGEAPGAPKRPAK
jgi:hypothetical protein